MDQNSNKIPRRQLFFQPAAAFAQIFADAGEHIRRFIRKGQRIGAKRHNFASVRLHFLLRRIAGRGGQRIPHVLQPGSRAECHRVTQGIQTRSRYLRGFLLHRGELGKQHRRSGKQEQRRKDKGCGCAIFGEKAGGPALFISAHLFQLLIVLILQWENARNAVRQTKTVFVRRAGEEKPCYTAGFFSYRFFQHTTRFSENQQKNSRFTAVPVIFSGFPSVSGRIFSRRR